MIRRKLVPPYSAEEAKWMQANNVRYGHRVRRKQAKQIERAKRLRA